MPDHGDNLNVAFGTVSDDGQEGEWHTHGDLEKLKVSQKNVASPPKQ